MSSDFELLVAWRDGDPVAGGQLFRRHFDTLYRFFVTKCDGPVDDLVQDTFLGCMRGRDRFRQEASFKTYLLRIARNRLYDHYKGRRREFDPMSTSAADCGGSPSSALVADERRAQLLAALRRIPIALQIALELYYWEGLRGPEVAEILDISDHTVRSRLSRARARLREQLDLLAEVPRRELETIEREVDFERWVKSLAPDSRP